MQPKYTRGKQVFQFTHLFIIVTLLTFGIPAFGAQYLVPVMALNRVECGKLCRQKMIIKGLYSE